MLQGSKKGDGSSSSSALQSRPTRVCQPGVDEIEEGEELQCDHSAYNSLHAFHVDWPCLRHSVVVPRQYSLLNSFFTKYERNIHGIRSKYLKYAISLAKGVMRYPPSRWAMMILRLIVIVPFPLTAAHQSCVNRIRPMPQSPRICASWSESGYVQIWDLSSHLTALAESETEGIQGASNVFNQAPLVS